VYGLRFPLPVLREREYADRRVAEHHFAANLPTMQEYAPELRLAWCIAINAIVFGAGYFFAARRMTASRSQAVLDAVLIGYGIQYASVGLPGMFGFLYPAVVTAVAIALAGLLVAASWRSTSRLTPRGLNPRSIAMIAIASFAGGMVLVYAHSQAVLPVFFNDALTYHFPAAVAWSQAHRITIFQTWFFNPANTYSPLAGSVFISWLMLPFDGDALARFVEVPALLAVGVGVYRLSRELGAAEIPAVLVAAAALLNRSLFLQCMMGKDDLFVVLFLLTAMVGMSRPRAGEPRGAVRAGLAIGLMLATKVTAALVLPTLLLAVDSPRWNLRRWAGMAATACVIAGPWYLRNWIIAGNPIFPLRVGHLFPGLFTTARSDELAAGGMRFVVGGSYSVPTVVAALLATVWISTFFVDRTWWKKPLTRAAVVGPLIGIVVFYFRSPFPEVRFITPLVAVLIALAGATVSRMGLKSAITAAAVIAIASLGTVEIWEHVNVVARDLAVPAVQVAGVATGLVVLAHWLSAPRRILVLYAPLLAAFAVVVFVYWAAYVRGYREVMFVDGSAYSRQYPDEFPLWKFVDAKIPANATVAYTNLYLVYPLIGPEQRRHLVYVPTRDGITTTASLPYLGDGLEGKPLVRAATAATIASPDAEGWLRRLDQSGATYLVVGLGDGVLPPELGIAIYSPARFRRVFASPSAVVFEVVQQAS
jgi:hypothetical protein